MTSALIERLKQYKADKCECGKTSCPHYAMVDDCISIVRQYTRTPQLPPDWEALREEVAEALAKQDRRRWDDMTLDVKARGFRATAREKYFERADAALAVVRKAL